MNYKTASSYFLSFLIISIVAWAFYASGALFGEAKQVAQKRSKIGLLVMATGSHYLAAAQQLVESAKKYFCLNHDVTYFIFTDGQLTMPGVIVLEQHRMGWPYDSMMRFATYYKYKDHFTDFDYLFACDADMAFVSEIGDEILSDRVGTIHPQTRFRRGIYEDNPLSTACIARCQGTHYFAGAFYGGTRDEFITLVHTAQEHINIDLARGYIARVNDESHLNWYFAQHKPTVLLGPEYCHFESWSSPYKAKLVARDSLDRNKKNMRMKPAFNPLGYYITLLKNEFENRQAQI
jgi:histo-blood group ABO system transferase